MAFGQFVVDFDSKVQPELSGLFWSCTVFRGKFELNELEGSFEIADGFEVAAVFAGKSSEKEVVDF